MNIVHATGFTRPTFKPFTLKSGSLITGALTLCLLSSPLLAQTPEERGLEIVQELDRRDKGWGDSEADMRMLLFNQQGDTSTREIRTQTLEVDDDGDKALIVFDEPKDVQGTAFLTFTHVTDADDQWLFLPARKRVKRISTKNKSGPFMGSEFSYEDMSSFEVDKYTYKYIKDDRINNLDCFMVESYPVYEHSGYTRLVNWVDKNEYRLQRVDYYDRKNSHLKTLTFGRYEQYLNKYWRPLHMSMVNHQTGKRTQLLWSNFRFRTGLDSSDFNKKSLERAK